MKEYADTQLGAATVSNNILNGKGRLMWCIREIPQADNDTGWTFLSEIDTEEYLDDINNWSVVTYESVIEIEPAILGIYGMPIGTDLTLIIDKKKRYFVDNETGKKIKV